MRYHDRDILPQHAQAKERSRCAVNCRPELPSQQTTSDTISWHDTDYSVTLEHEGGKDPFSRDNKFPLFNRDGDVIKSGSTRSLGNAVKEACRVIMNDWREPSSRKETLATKSEKSGS